MCVCVCVSDTHTHTHTHNQARSRRRHAYIDTYMHIQISIHTQHTNTHTHTHITGPEAGGGMRVGTKESEGGGCGGGGNNAATSLEAFAALPCARCAKNSWAFGLSSDATAAGVECTEAIGAAGFPARAASASGLLAAVGSFHSTTRVCVCQ